MPPFSRTPFLLSLSLISLSLSLVFFTYLKLDVPSISDLFRQLFPPTNSAQSISTSENSSVNLAPSQSTVTPQPGDVIANPPDSGSFAALQSFEAEAQQIGAPIFGQALTLEPPIEVGQSYTTRAWSKVDPEFDAFVKTVTDGSVGVVRGVYIPNVFAMPIVQQPDSEPAFVSAEGGVITQFSSAAKQGVTGLLAHNYLAGIQFYNLELNDEVRIVYGNGLVRRYRVDRIEQFQRLDFTRLNGDFIDLSNNKRMSSNNVFAQFYSGGDFVTFQTCLERNGKLNWGLHFVVARPID